jgi:hypothetical protein
MRPRVAHLRRSLREQLESPITSRVCDQTDREGQTSSAESVSSSRDARRDLESDSGLE